MSVETEGAISTDPSDPDLPGDAQFVPVVSTGDHIAKPVELQAAIHHNQLRYAELQKLRQGQPNQYRETRYR